MEIILQRLDTVALILVPVLFWVSVGYGFIVGNMTSHPHFMGSQKLSRCFVVVAVLFVVNLLHSIAGVRFLFGGPFMEYALITAVMSGLLALSAWHDRKLSKVDISGDPRLKKCPKCGSVMDIIVAECPKCESPV